MGTEDLADRLAAIAEEMADLALDRLSSASGAVRGGGEVDPAVLVEERRLTRARRSVEKAVAVLREAPGADGTSTGADP